MATADTTERLHIFQACQNGSKGGLGQVQILRAAPPVQLSGSIQGIALCVLAGSYDESLVCEVHCGSLLVSVRVAGGEAWVHSSRDMGDQVQWVRWIKDNQGMLTPIACIAGEVHVVDSDGHITPLTAVEGLQIPPCSAASGTQLLFKVNETTLARLTCERHPHVAFRLVQRCQAFGGVLLGYEERVGWISSCFGKLEVWGRHGVLLHSLEGLDEPVVHIGAIHTVIAHGSTVVLCVLVPDSAELLIPNSARDSKKLRKSKSGLKALKDR